jgi:hypothetical protein
MGMKLSPQLHLCPVCGSNLVQPVDYEPLERSSCYVELLCPNCWSSRRGVHDQADFDRFSEELERGDAAMLATVAEVTRSNMQEQIDRFSRALEADAILPIDF